MSNQAKKPRDIKDLKARLGRRRKTTVGQGAFPQTGTSGGVQPPPGFGTATGTHVPAPPFMRQSQGGASPQMRTDSGPFTAQQASQNNEVRLVIDDSAVQDAEVGRKKSFRSLIVVSVGLIMGVLVGYGAGSTMGDRKQYNYAVADGKAVLSTVDEAAKVVEEASQLLDDVAQTATGASGSDGPKVAYEKIEALRALKKPFEAASFSRKRYSAFKTATVDALFQYFNKINLAWDKLEALATHTLPDARRRDLNAALKATAELASAPTGCVPSKVNDQIVCNLVYISVAEQGGGVTVSAKRRGMPVAKTVYAGQDLSKQPEQYVILTNTPTSLDILGQRASVFAEFQHELMQLKAMFAGKDKGGSKSVGLLELQGRLQKELGEIARLNPVFTL